MQQTRNSWGVMTAAQNFVRTAEQINPASPNTINAWKHLLNGQSSDYWYWDYAQNGIWDSHPTRAANQVIQFAQSVISSGTDLTGPTIYLPQREPYNPGGFEWSIPMQRDFMVWTYVFDVSGLQSVKLKYRLDHDGVNDPNTTHNETYAGGSDVTDWTEIIMTGIDIPSQTNPLPLFKAKQYSAMINGFTNKLVDYYIEAADNNGNISRSPIRHVWVGDNSGSGSSGVSWSPVSPSPDDEITITVAGVQQGAKLHWGVNNQGNQWQTPNQVYWTPGTVLYNGTGPAVESPFQGPVNDTLTITIGPFNNPVQQVQRVAFVIHFNDGSWNNNNGNDFIIHIGGGGFSFIMDGEVDPTAIKVATNNGLDLYLGWNGTEFYAATQSAQSTGNDHFIFVSDSTNNMVPAPWAKTGMAAAWNAFLGNESTNNWSGWFDNTGTTQNAAGNFLEGTLDIAGEFGYIPQTLYVAVGSYQTEDQGTLVNQVPAGNGNGNIEPGELYAFSLSTTSNKSEKETINFLILENFPNPFNPVTTIRFSVPDHITGKNNSNSETMVDLRVFDILGREIAILVSEPKSPGIYELPFNAANLPGGKADLASGIYFTRLEAGGIVLNRKIILIK